MRRLKSNHSLNFSEQHRKKNLVVVFFSPHGNISEVDELPNFKLVLFLFNINILFLLRLSAKFDQTPKESPTLHVSPCFVKT